MKKNLHNRVNRQELKARLQGDPAPRTTLSFYRYLHIDNPAAFRDALFDLYQRLGVLGRIYVAQEGVNAQLSVPTERFEAFKTAMDSLPGLQNLRLNVAVEAEGKSFFALIIKVRDKIVADGIDDPSFDPSLAGRHLDAEAFNRLTDAPDTLLVDMRNRYESEVGHFENAILPDAETFREELPMVAELLAEHKKRNIVMYCTGGIRCEKASAWLRHQGFENVFQLDGGIIEYARQVRAKGLKNKFLGKNFVFDERLGERISEAVIAHCHQCGAPNDDHANCANPYCHRLIIQCPECRERYAGCCSEQCHSFLQLPEAERQSTGKTLHFPGSVLPNGSRKNQEQEVLETL